MEVEEKRANSHGVAGVTEGDTYCTKSNLGDRALSLFFNTWDEYETPTYSSCSYDTGRSESNICKEIEFAATNVDGYWFYVYSGYSGDEHTTYTAFYNDNTYKAVTNPVLYHNFPAAALKFNLGTTAGFNSINGYFYYVEFKYDDSAYIGTEAELRSYADSTTKPSKFMIFAETNVVQEEEASFTKWGAVNEFEYDQYDGVFEWATYGWARSDGYFED